MNVSMNRKMFTVEEYYRMAEANILSHDDRVELIEGEIITMTPIVSRHAAQVDHMYQYFFQHLSSHVLVRGQNPIRLSDSSEPVPDIALVKHQHHGYKKVLPTSEDVLLLVEVCDTSYDFDLRVKVPLYSRYGVPEVWLVHLEKQRVEQFFEPEGEAYSHHRVYQRGQSVSLTSLSTPAFLTEDLLV